MLYPPYANAYAITPSDTVNLMNATTGGLALSDAVYVGGAGVVVAVLEDNRTVNFTCVAGQVLPLRVKRINATNTTATLLVALYR